LVGFIVLIALTIGIMHELIHGITWAKYTKDGFKSIRFGVLWKFLTLLPLQRAIISQTLYNWRLCQLLSWGFFLLYYPLSLAMYFVNFWNIFHNGRLW
jgi:hypothetical protein